MSYSSLRDQRGVTMLLELVLISLVLALVGVALYQSNHQKPAAAAVQSQLTTPASTADATTNLVERDAADDATMSGGVDTAADELNAASNDATNLAGSFDENSF